MHDMGVHLKQQSDVAAGRGARRAGGLGARHRHVLPRDGGRVQMHQLRHVLQLRAGQITLSAPASTAAALTRDMAMPPLANCWLLLLVASCVNAMCTGSSKV